MRLFLRKRAVRRYREIAPDEIFLDSKNLPQFNTAQFEGRLERPLGRKSLIALGVFFCVIGVVFLLRAWRLEIADWAAYVEESEENMVDVRQEDKTIRHFEIPAQEMGNPVTKINQITTKSLNI